MPLILSCRRDEMRRDLIHILKAGSTTEDNRTFRTLAATRSLFTEAEIFGRAH